MSRTTEALVVDTKGGNFRLGHVQLASISPDDVLVEIEATGVCHSDIGCASGELPGGFPGVYGHEGAGIVLEVGSNVPSGQVNTGDKVLLSFYHCQQCESCQDGHPAYCANAMQNFAGVRIDGTSAMRTSSGEAVFSSFLGQSSFAKTTLAHKSCVVKVAQDTKLAIYAPMGCGIQTGAGAILNTLNVTANSTLAVFGVGAVGMSALLAGKMRAVKKLVAVDLLDSRLELAKQLGATDVFKGDDPEVGMKIRKLCEPALGLNFAVDCTGVPQVVETMLSCLGKRGRAATVGAPSPGQTVNVDVWNQLIMGREYVGCCEGDSNPTQFIPYLIEQHKQGNFPIDSIITVYPMQDFQKAIDDTKSGRTVKAILKW